jgi:hypothetical protein
LKSYHSKLRRLSGETQAASLAAEDALATVEDRERHRVARTAAADNELRDKYRGLKEGR